MLWHSNYWKHEHSSGAQTILTFFITKANSNRMYRASFYSAIKPVLLLIVILATISTNAAASTLFGYKETQQKSLQTVSHWVKLVARHIKEDTPEGDCGSQSFNRCHLRSWMAFLDQIRHLPRTEQLTAINQYANRKKYIIDLENYSTPDYWAIVKEFLFKGGDCEDYAITKLFSMRELGYSIDMARIVVLQDTNLNIPHAVLAFYTDDDILILDNQIQTIESHRNIAHYIPLYAVNESRWWIYSPSHY